MPGTPCKKISSEHELACLPTGVVTPCLRIEKQKIKKKKLKKKKLKNKKEKIEKYFFIFFFLLVITS